MPSWTKREREGDPAESGPSSDRSTSQAPFPGPVALEAGSRSSLEEKTAHRGQGGAGLPPRLLLLGWWPQQGAAPPATVCREITCLLLRCSGEDFV